MAREILLPLIWPLLETVEVVIRFRKATFPILLEMLCLCPSSHQRDASDLKEHHRHFCKESVENIYVATIHAPTQHGSY